MARQYAVVFALLFGLGGYTALAVAKEVLPADTSMTPRREFPNQAAKEGVHHSQKDALPSGYKAEPNRSVENNDPNSNFEMLPSQMPSEPDPAAETIPENIISPGTGTPSHH